MPEAIRELDEAIRLDPRNARYKTTLAIALDSLGSTQEAFDLLGRAVFGWRARLRSARTAVRYGLRLRRFPKTLEYAEALTRLRPDDL